MDNKMTTRKARRGISQKEGIGKGSKTNNRPQQGGRVSLKFCLHGVLAWFWCDIAYYIAIDRGPSIIYLVLCMAGVMPTTVWIHCRVAQYNARISTNTKASLTPGKCLATPTGLYNTSTHILHGQGPRNFYETPTPGSATRDLVRHWSTKSMNSERGGFVRGSDPP